MSATLKVLIVDDFEMVRVMLKNTLKSLGYTDFSEAENGFDAWKKIEEAHSANKPYQIIFCDWNMPEMGGIEFLEKCRADAKYKDVPIIMVTAEAEQDHIVTALKKGATDYIIKPISPEMLEKKVKKAIAKLQKPA